MNKAAFRVDASTAIGNGHLMRCLVLANALREHGAEIHFICRNLSAIFETALAEQEIALHPLPAAAAPTLAGPGPAHEHWLGADWEADANASLEILGFLGGVDLLVVDHYAIDARWERCVRAKAKKILVIDDLADRAHACDVLLDQNFHTDQNARYKGHLGEKTQCLLGPRYALLRPQFAQARQAFPRADRPQSPVARINVCFGGVDAAGETLKALRALERGLETQDLAVDVILGEASPHRVEIEAWAKRYPALALHVSHNNVAQLLALADLGIGAAGSMTWERACVGLPSIAIAIAQNQRRLAEEAGRIGAHLFIGESQSVSIEQLQSAIAFLIGNASLRQSFAATSQQLVDGRGANRVAASILPPAISLRRAAMDDCERVFAWRNDPVNRRHAHDAHVITYQEHCLWFEQVFKAGDRFLLIGSDNEGPVGVLRYDRRETYWMTSIYLVPGRHGRRLGTPLLLAGTEWLRIHCKGPMSLRAEIQSGNVASEKAFQSAGYEKRFSTFVADMNP